MNVWKLTAAGNLVKTEEEARPVAGGIRVRVTKVFVTKEDADLLKGKVKVKYPLIPGRFAVGLVADENGGTRFPKGARVLLHSYLPAEDTGSEKKTFCEDDFRICGRTADGFFRDFVFAREDEMTLLPDAVNDEKALLLYHVALAQATIETLDVKRGEHIAVIGGSLLGLFVCRLLIYRQAAPILIDARPDRLEFARLRGVYYTSLPDGTLMETIGTVTGGRLADGVVYVTGESGCDSALPLSVCATDKHIAFSGVGTEALSLELSEVVKKRLTVHGVSDGTDYLEMAINFIANKAVDLSAFRFVTFPAEKLVLLLEALAEGERPADEIDIVSLV